MGPVMFYAPKDGDKAEVQNSKPPLKEFPEY